MRRINSKRLLNRQNHRRQANGYLITELSAAIGLLFIGFFFPLLDLINIGFIYGSGFTLNNLQARQCAVVTKSEANDPAGIIMWGIPQQWKATGLGRFVKLQGDPQTSVSYTNGQTESSGVQDKNVVISTTIIASPFLTIPFAPGVPGLNAPMTFQFFSQCVLENPNDANS